jgi:hypothetical protein
MMHAAVRTVDDGVDTLFQFVIEALGDKTSNDRAVVSILQGEVTNTALDTVLGQDSVNAFDDVVALTKLPKGWLATFRQPPACWTEQLSYATRLAHPSNHACLKMPLPCSVA